MPRLLSLLLLAGLASPAVADVPGTFVGAGTYATAEGC